MTRVNGMTHKAAKGPDYLKRTSTCGPKEECESQQAWYPRPRKTNDATKDTLSGYERTLFGDDGDGGQEHGGSHWSHLTGPEKNTSVDCILGTY